MQCPESPRVQANFDGELDAVDATEIERHIEHCDECSAQLQDLDQVRTALRRDLAFAPTPPALRARVMRALDHESAVTTPQQNRWAPRTWSERSFWTGAFSGVGGTLIAAAFAFILLAPTLNNPLLDELVSAHLRSLMPAHLIDVASSDKHTVKPWFAGHADSSPVVADFDQQGYRLVGGRADYIASQRVAVVVYQHGSHVINVFSWTAARGNLPHDKTRNGYHLIFWKTGDLANCAVSDTGWDKLQGLVRLLRDLGAQDNREQNGINLSDWKSLLLNADCIAVLRSAIFMLPTKNGTPDRKLISTTKRKYDGIAIGETYWFN